MDEFLGHKSTPVLNTTQPALSEGLAMCDARRGQETLLLRVRNALNYHKDAQAGSFEGEDHRKGA